MLKRPNAYLLFLIIGGVSSFFLRMIFTVLAIYYVMTVGMNALQLVLVGTVIESTIFLFEIPTGVVSDRYSRRLSVIIGFSLIGVCYLITGAVPIFVAILVAEFIRGIGETFISGASSAWIVDELGRDSTGQDSIGEVFVRQQQMSLAGSILGIAVGAGLGVLGLAIPILVGGVGLLLLAGFLALTMTEHGFEPARDHESESWRQVWATTQEGFDVIRLQPVAFLFVVVGIVYGASSEGFDRLWEAHYLQNIVLPTRMNLPPVIWFGVINTVSMLIGIAVSEGIIRRMDLRNPSSLRRILLVSTIVLMFSIIAFGLAPTFLVATLAYWLANGFRALQYPIAQTWLNQNIPSRVRATVLSMVSQADAVGQIAGGPIVGIVGLRSLQAAMVFSGLLLSPAILLYARGASAFTDRRTDDAN